MNINGKEMTAASILRLVADELERTKVKPVEKPKGNIEAVASVVEDHYTVYCKKCGALLVDVDRRSRMLISANGLSTMMREISDKHLVDFPECAVTEEGRK